MFTRFFARLTAVVVVGGTMVSGAMAASLSENPPPGSITLGNNRHNMSSNATHGGVRAAAPPDGTDQICIFCHTPHGAAAEGPLWNRNAPTGSFQLYSGTLAIKGDIPGALNVNAPNSTKYRTSDPGDPNFVYPNGSSRLCMSCHDGVTAVNILRNGGTIAMVANPALLDPDGSLKGTLPNIGAGGTAIGSVIDLSTSHPISFVYTDNIVNTIINPAYIAAGLPDRYDGPSAFVATVDTPLDSQSRMQCTTCHDPHLDTSLVNGALPPFWRQTTGATPYQDVCNNCHQTAASPLTPVHPP
jgi:mono/diheme cytochrome c family protein